MRHPQTTDAVQAAGLQAAELQVARLQVARLQVARLQVRHRQTAAAVRPAGTSRCDPSKSVSQSVNK